MTHYKEINRNVQIFIDICLHTFSIKVLNQSQYRAENNDTPNITKSKLRYIFRKTRSKSTSHSTYLLLASGT